MDRNKLITCVRRLNSLQAIHFTFSNNGIGGVRRLMQLVASNSAVRIDENQKTGLSAVAESGRWERVSKTVMVWGITEASDVQLGSIANDIESISAGEHFAKGIFTNKISSRQATFDTITSEVLNLDFQTEMAGWDVRIEPKLIEIDGLPAIQFNILNAGNSNHLFAFVIDGWSGRYGVQNIGDSFPKWGDRRFSDSHGVREQIYSATIYYLADATAP